MGPNLRLAVCIIVFPRTRPYYAGIGSLSRCYRPSLLVDLLGYICSTCLLQYLPRGPWRGIWVPSPDRRVLVAWPCALCRSADLQLRFTNSRPRTLLSLPRPANHKPSTRCPQTFLLVPLTCVLRCSFILICLYWTRLFTSYGYAPPPPTRVILHSVKSVCQESLHIIHHSERTPCQILHSHLV